MEPAPARSPASGGHALLQHGWIWGPAWLQMALIFALSSFSDLPALPGGVSDKLAHGVTYALLGALMLRGLARGRWSGVTAAAAAGAVALTVLYGCSDEAHQGFVPGRTPDLNDLMVDAFGAGCAVAALWAWGIIRPGRAGASRRATPTARPPA